MITKEQIVETYNRVRDCEVAEWENKQKMMELELQNTRLHHETLLAKDALNDLKD